MICYIKDWILLPRKLSINIYIHNDKWHHIWTSSQHNPLYHPRPASIVAISIIICHILIIKLKWKADAYNMYYRIMIYLVKMVKDMIFLLNMYVHICLNKPLTSPWRQYVCMHTISNTFIMCVYLCVCECFRCTLRKLTCCNFCRYLCYGVCC